MTRPDEEGNCPAGTEPCSAATSAENTVCYPRAEHQSACPITALSVVDAAGKDGLSSDEEEAMKWELAGLLSGDETAGDAVYLAYSKAADSLPVSLTFVGSGQPCRDTNKLLPSEQPWYPLENGREAEDCPAVEDNGATQGELGIDTRFKHLTLDSGESETVVAATLQASLQDVETASGVTAILAELPGGKAFNEENRATKEGILYNFYSRTNLPWKLSCEAKRPRATIVRILRESVTEVYYSGRTIALFGVILIAATAIVGLGAAPGLWDGRNKAFLVLAVTFLIAMQVSLALSTMFFLSTTWSRFDTRIDATNRLAAVNGCSDEMTVMPFIDAEADFTETDANLRTLITVTVLMIVTSLATGVLTIPSYYCVHYVSDIEDRGAMVGQGDDLADVDAPVGAGEGKLATEKRR